MRFSHTRISLMTVAILLLYSCDKTVIIEPRAPLPVHERTQKSRKPIETGTIRGYFGDRYITFTEQIEKVQPVDSFSNCYFYGSCDDFDLKQINLIRCHDEYVAAIFINGVSPDSLPAGPPFDQVFGRSAEIQFYAYPSWNSTSSGHYSLSHFYGNNVVITDYTGDVLTGTFNGLLGSASGGGIWVSDGEFKIRIFRKHMPCGKDSE
ncbi:MAG: hypothetical protein RBT38_14400 [Bacteroidales bacterium]|jgi:hypothetical protein|nr:hypothetical protein [Bacteroidales bacterium]